MLIFSKKFPFFSRIKAEIRGNGNDFPEKMFKWGGGRKNRFFVCGNDNRIEIGENISGKLNLMIFGNGNRIEIGSDVLFNGLSVYIGLPDAPCEGGVVSIGEKTTFSGTGCFRLAENHSRIVIGTDVMFSEHFDVWASDTHSVLDSRGNAKNIGKTVFIGSHTWIGKDVKIGKNVEIGGGSIVGWGSVVPAGKYPERSLIAGNPARVRKNEVAWSRLPPNISK